MTLIITFIAALVATVLWKLRGPEDRMRFGALALMYWGAALMWCVDGFACLAEGEGFVELSDAAAMFDDALLGALVVVVGLAVWAIYVAVKNSRSRRSLSVTR